MTQHTKIRKALAGKPEDGSLGARIKRLRKQRGLTQTELAQQSGISQPSISDIETGESKDIAAETLLRISLALGIDPFKLFFGNS